MAEGNRVGVVMTCMDCRLHKKEALHIEQLEQLLGVDDVYVETEAGPDGVVCEDGDRCMGAVENLVVIKNAKKPDVYAVIAHYDCAGHAVSDADHDRDVVEAADRISVSVLGEPGKVLAIIAYPNSSADGPTWLLKKMNEPSAVSELRETVAA